MDLGIPPPTSIPAMADGEVLAPSSAPAQTLTFLFSDLREYTPFVESYGDAAAAALIAAYREIVRAEVARTGGAEIKTEGDSFYVVFHSARAALDCAVRVLRAAERHTRERPDRPIRIGIGVHAGEPVPQEGQYVGSAVNVAARIAAKASAGELLVSGVVRGLIRTSATPPLEDRGEVELKGVAESVRLYSVTWRAGTDVDTSPMKPQPAETAVPADAPQGRQILCKEIVGRQKDLDALFGALASARARTGRAVLIGGEAGLGKSALLRRFGERATAEGASVLVGECIEVEARKPFGPFVQILRAALREQSAGDAERSLREHAVELMRFVPELARASATEPSVDQAERYRLHESFVSLFADLARDHPLVLVVEDLHWADEATLELFPYLARRLRAEPVLLLGTYRTDELHRTHPLNGLLAEVARTRVADRIRLQPLTLEETGAAMTSALGLKRPPSVEFRQAVHEHCEGSPFFIEEVLKALVERGDLAHRDGAWRRTKEVRAIAIPDSIRDAVRERLRRLPEEARQVLRIAAVIGQRFDLDLLLEIVGLAEREVLAALRTAIDGQLVVEVQGDDAQETYSFRHALTREIIVGELMQRERRQLHRAIAEATEKRAGPGAAAEAEELAYHFDEARDNEKALRYHGLAAREARRLFAFARAARHLERWLELAPDDHHDVAEMQLMLAHMANLLNDYERAGRAADAAHAAFMAADDVRGGARALMRRTAADWSLGRPTRDLGERIVRMVEPLGDTPELAKAYVGLAASRAIEGHDDQALSLAEKALALARRIGDAEAEAQSAPWIGLIRTRRGDAGGLEILRSGLDIALRNELVETAQGLYHNTAVALNDLGRPRAEHRELLEQRLAHARRYGYRSSALVSTEAAARFLDGEWDAVLSLAEELDPASIWSAGARLSSACIVALRGGPAALPPLDPIVQQLTDAQLPQWLAGRGLAVATRYLSGDLRGAVEGGEMVAELVAQDMWQASPHWAAIAVIDAARRGGDDIALRRWVDLASAVTDSPRLANRARAAFASAEDAVLHGDRDGAIALLEEHREFFEDFAWLPAGLLRIAELRAERDGPGDRDAAQRSFDYVAAFFTKAKATWYLGQLSSWAAERGLTFQAG